MYEPPGPTPLEIIQRLAFLAPRRIATIAKPGPHCILASKVGQLVLQQFGILVEPLVVEITICNQAWMDWGRETQFSGGEAEQLRRGAYILTNSPDWKGKELPPTVAVDAPWDGHLVLQAEGQLIDLDLGAFSRPAQGLYVPSSVVAPLFPEGVQGEYERDGKTTYLQYRPLEAAYKNDYLQSRDWTADERYADVVWGLEHEIQALHVMK